MNELTAAQRNEGMNAHFETQRELHESLPECCGVKMTIEDSGSVESDGWLECIKCGKTKEL